MARALAGTDQLADRRVRQARLDDFDVVSELVASSFGLTQEIGRAQFRIGALVGNHQRGLPFVTTHGWRIVPWLAVNIRPGNYCLVTLANDGRGRRQMNSIRQQLRVDIDIAGPDIAALNIAVRDRKCSAL